MHANLNKIPVFSQEIIHGVYALIRGISLMSRVRNLLAVVATAVSVTAAPAFATVMSGAELSRAHNAEIDASMTPVGAVQAAEFERARNDEIMPRWPRSHWCVARNLVRK